jgi:hypothetical protein
VLKYAEARYDDPTFRGVRIAVGLNGLLLRCADVHEIVSAILFGPVARVPIDYLLGESWFESGKRIVTYRTAQMRHIGQVSTVGNDAAKYDPFGEFSQLPTCDHIISFHVAIPPQEMFVVAECCNQLFSPCDPESMARVQGKVDTAAPELPPPSASGLTTVTADRDTNCDDACATRKLRCRADFVAHINKCATLQNNFDCRDCVTLEGHDLPAFDHTKVGNNGGKCLVSGCSKLFSCKGKHPRTMRLCPCGE